MLRKKLNLALICGLLAATPHMALAQNYAEIELTGEQSVELSRLKAGADAIDQFSDPQGYRAAYLEVVDFARTLYPDPHPEVVKLEAEVHFANFLLGNRAGLREEMADAIAIYEKSGLKYRPQLIESYNNLSVISDIMGFAADSIGWQEKAVAMWQEDAPPEGTSDLGQGLSNLARLQQSLGRHEDALASNAAAIVMLETLHEKSSDNRELTDALVVALSNRMMHLDDLGRQEEAMQSAREIAARVDQLIGVDALGSVVILLNNSIYLTNQGKHTDAEAMARRAVAIREKIVGPETVLTAEARLVLIASLLTQNRFLDALPMLEHSYGVLDAEIGPSAAMTLEAQAKLARTYFELGQTDRGISEMRTMLSKFEEIRPPLHRDVTENQDYLAQLLASDGRWDELEVLLDLVEKSRMGTPLEHQASYTVMQVLRAMGEAQRDKGDAALARLDAAIPVLLEFWQAELQQEGARGARNIQLNRALGWAMDVAMDIDDAERAFALAQRFNLGPSDRAVLSARQRDAAADPQLAKAIRARQDLIEQRSQALATFERAIAAGGGDEARAANSQFAALNAEIEALGPDQSAFALELVSLADVQSRLSGEEAVFMSLETDRVTRIFAISSDKIVLTSAGLSPDHLADLVGGVRSQLDWDLASGESFETGETDALYSALFTPEVEAVLDGKNHVQIIAKGSLSKLPFSLLTRSREDGARQWAIERFAFSYPIGLAGIGKAHEEAGERGFASFIGIGAPSLPDSGALLARANTSGDAEAPVQLAFRGAENARKITDLGELGLAEGELRAMADAINADEAHILAGAGATEAAMRNLELTGADIITFATHGLMAGELDGLNEAALVLSPPPAGEAFDADNDGLLTTSEISALDLQARWVVLSACNSASGDRLGDEAFGGLASAFLYAGVDTLLVSHWRVRDDAAARLTVATAEGAAAGLKPAEALRQAKLALMADSSVEGSANPALWAPFVLVGS